MSILIEGKGVDRPLGCPIDEIQMPKCLEQECILWMYCKTYWSVRKDKIKEQAREEQNDEYSD